MSRPLELSDSELQTLIVMAGEAVTSSWVDRKQSRDHLSVLRRHDFLAQHVPAEEARLARAEQQLQEFEAIRARLHRLDLERRVDAQLQHADQVAP